MRLEARRQKPEGATGHALVQKSTVADIHTHTYIIYIYIYIYVYISHDFQIWLPQPFALGCAGWSPVGPSA